MADFVYPSRDLHQPPRLLGLLGSHWSYLFGEQQQVESYARSLAVMESQKELDIGEAAATVSRLDNPVFHKVRWQQLLLKESERNATSVAVLKYGAGGVYGGDESGVEYRYGIPQADLSVFPAPAGLHSVNLIFNRLTEPSVTFVYGQDFYLDTGAIVFRENPFDNELVAIRDVFEDGEVSDREVMLWLSMSLRETDLVYNHVGYVVGVELPSSQTYLDFSNSVWDAAVESPSDLRLRNAIAAATDTPVVRTESEEVLHIVKDARNLLIITDAHVYKYPQDVSAVVAVGDTVLEGDQLVDTVTFYDFRRGETPAAIRAIEMSREFLPPGYYGGLVFENKADAAVTVDSSGVFTRLEFAIGGWPNDITKFWDDFHDRGIASPPTLAQLLDERTVKTGEPESFSLPETINPLEFLIENVLRYNAFAVVIKLGQRGANKLNTVHLRHLRKIIPPTKALIIIVELAADTEVITMDGPGSETLPGYEESPSLGFGLEPISESIDGSAMITENPTLTYVEGICI